MGGPLGFMTEQYKIFIAVETPICAQSIRHSSDKPRSAIAAIYFYFLSGHLENYTHQLSQ